MSKQLLLAFFLISFSRAQPLQLDDAPRDCIEELARFGVGRIPPRICAPDIQREPIVAGTISAERLRHPLPREASRAIEQAHRLSQSGRIDQAAEKLRSVAEKFPEFWEIHYNLGVSEMKLGALDRAAQEFERTRELNPRFVPAAVACGYVLLRLDRLNEARRAVRDAVALEPSNQIAKTLLARMEGAGAP